MKFRKLDPYPFVERPYCHARENGHPEKHGFPVKPGMTWPVVSR